MNEFQENILDHYKNPRNFGNPGWEVTLANEVRNISCGDEIKLFIQTDNKDIKRLAFEGQGCSICIGSASILTEEFRNKSITEAINMSDDKYIKGYLGIDLTESRKKCALLAFEALKTALK